MGPAVDVAGANQGSPTLPEGYAAAAGMELGHGWGLTERWLPQHTEQPWITERCIAAAVRA
jgi:hypothetical protein